MSREPSRLLAAVTRHPVSFAGAVLATVCATIFLALLVLSWAGRPLGPYVGLLAYVALPAGFVLGLLLLPVGWLRRRHQRPLPVIDLGEPRWRRRLLVVTALTVLNLALLSAATYEGVHLLESNAFCGQACHTEMEPQATAFAAGPHAATRCVDCHVGAGPRAFVEAKLNGTSQLWAVMTDTVPRPIPPPPSPVHGAGETCAGCHDPGAWLGDRLAVLPRTAPDEANTPLATVLWLHVGGARGGEYRGIHWHADPSRRVRYRLAGDGGRALEVEVEEGGEVTRWTRPEGTTGGAGEEIAGSWQTLGCSGCHNRVGHPFRTPGEALDAAFEEGRLPRELPGLKAVGLELLEGAAYGDPEAARAGLAAAVAERFPEAPPAETGHAGAVLGDLWAANVFPAMAVTWGTYPDQAGHERFPGCFRCHDEELTAPDGRVLAQDCFGACHEPVAIEEESPDILAALAP